MGGQGERLPERFFGFGRGGGQGVVGDGGPVGSGATPAAKKRHASPEIIRDWESLCAETVVPTRRRVGRTNTDAFMAGRFYGTNRILRFRL